MTTASACEVRLFDALSTIGPGDWGQLDTSGNPFLSYAFLHGLEQSGSIAPENGWSPCHIALYDIEGLAACAPSYLKTHSRGEFVFDWAWAEAYHRHGLAYYPKLLSAIPWSPVSGQRLLLRRGIEQPETWRRRLIRAAKSICIEQQLSSWHCNFVTPQELQALQAEDLLIRSDVQFHWLNRGYADFDEYLATLKSRKRKAIRKERHRLHQAGIEFEWKSGQDITASELDFMYRCYHNTFQAYGNYPALTPEFFTVLVAAPESGLQLVLAHKADQAVAMSLYLQSGDCLFGRYWGCLEHVPGLHFETAYYQGIEHCIRQGLQRFESGAQGEHKISRGFEPQSTHSGHFVVREDFRTAINRHLDKEAQWMQQYREQLAEQSPFRADASEPGS